MPGLANTLLGKSQKTFRLLTEETSNKWRRPVLPTSIEPGDASDASDANTHPASVANEFEAGAIVVTSQYGIAPVAYGATDAVGTQIGVAMDNHTAALNECEGSNQCTVVSGHHFGQTQKYDPDVAYVKGAKLYPKAGLQTPTAVSNGLFTSATVGTPVAIVETEPVNGWLTYEWIGPDMA